MLRVYSYIFEPFVLDHHKVVFVDVGLVDAAVDLLLLIVIFVREAAAALAVFRSIVVITVYGPTLIILEARA